MLLTHYYEGCPSPSFSDTSRAIRGHFGTHASHFSPDCRGIALRAFGTVEQAVPLLIKHSMFGIVTRAADSRVVASVANDIASTHRGQNHNSAFISLHYKVRCLVSRKIRWCDLCHRDDLSGLGYPAWRVLHQLNQLPHCPYHNTPLFQDPSGLDDRRGNVLGKLTNLAKGGARVQVESSLADSEGYSRFMRRWQELLNGRLDELSVNNWIKVMRSIEEASSVRLIALIALVEDWIENAWCMPIAKLADSLGMQAGTSFVDEELSLRTGPEHLGRRMIVREALLGLGLIKEETEGQRELPLVQQRLHGDGAGPSKLAELQDKLISAGISPALVGLLQEDISRPQLALRAKLDARQISCMLDAIPRQTLLGVFEAGEWSDHSWIYSAIHRPGLTVRTSSHKWAFRSDHSALPN